MEIAKSDSAFNAALSDKYMVTPLTVAYRVSLSSVFFKYILVKIKYNTVDSAFKATLRPEQNWSYIRSGLISGVSFYGIIYASGKCIHHFKCQI